MLADGAAHAQNSAVVSVPVTNLNIGMTMWNPSAPPGANKMQSNPSMLSPVVVPTPVMGHEGMMPGHWMPLHKAARSYKKNQPQHSKKAACSNCCPPLPAAVVRRVEKTCNSQLPKVWPQVNEAGRLPLTRMNVN